MHNTLTICNVATSAMVRECKLSYITRAGVEIGVASTKAFTRNSRACSCSPVPGPDPRAPDGEEEAKHLKAMRHLPVALQPCWRWSRRSSVG